MKAIVLSNGELEVKEIKNTLEELQGIVGGYIEMPYISKVFLENEIDMVINEEGKYIEGLKPEIAVISKEGNVVLDLVMGSCVFVSHDDAGNTVDLNDKQIEIVMEELKLQTELYNPKEETSFITRALFV